MRRSRSKEEEEEERGPSGVRNMTINFKNKSIQKILSTSYF